MAVQPNIGSTTANDLINAAAVVPFVIGAARATPIYEALAMILDLKNHGSNVADVPSWDAPSAPEETVEADEVVSVNYTTSKKSITGVRLSTRSLITDQFVQDAGNLASGAVDEMSANIRNTIDLEVLELFKTASNMSDNTGVNLTLALWAASKTLFKAQKPGNVICYVGSGAQLRDILNDMAASAGGQQIAAAGLAVFGSEVIDGYHGLYRGCHIFESSNVAAADGANDVGGFVSIVPGAGGAAQSGLALGVWEMIKAEGVRVPSRHGLDVTVSARVGFSRSNERMVRGLISKRAA